MKKKITVFGILILALTTGIVLSNPQSSYADTFVTCEIVRIGSQAGTAMTDRIRLTHIPESGSAIFTDQLFLFNSTTSKQMLATALTALSLNKTVYVAIDDDGITLNRLFVDQ